MASIKASPSARPPDVEPAEIYRSTYAHLNPRTPGLEPLALRIATGGAGQSGLIRALAEAFIQQKEEYWSRPSEHINFFPAILAAGKAPFDIAWYASDTSQSFNYLAQNVVDMSITYHAGAEGIALKQGIADRREYLFRDHWMLVGPQTNPANLPLPPTIHTALPITDLLTTIFLSATNNTPTTLNPTRFLSRYDKSANNILESSLWASIGQTPWSEPYSHWYHRYVEFPVRALECASKLGEYTIVDWGTWWTVGEEIRKEMVIFKVGTDDLDDSMLNPAHALVGTSALNKAIANEFVDWVISDEGGQEVLRTFKKNGVLLYSVAPPRP